MDDAMENRRFSLIIDRELREEIADAARKSDRSAGSFIRTCVREQLKQRDQRADRD
jgi:hypothetical protein